MRAIGHCVVPALCGSGLMHCTLISDFDSQQCSTTADCELLEGEIRRCEESRCVPGCSNNAHCLSIDPRLPLCQRPGGQCVALVDAASVCSTASGYDDQRLATLTLEDLDLVGAFGPVSRSATWLSLRLAADEWNAALGDMDGSRARPLLAIFCEDSVEGVQAALPHLIQRLGVRALLAPTSEGSLRAALESLAVGAPAFLLSPAGLSVQPQDIPGASELLWYLGAEYAATLPGYAALLPRAVALGQARAAVPGAFRVASVVGADPEDGALSDGVLAALQVDGLDADRLLIADRLRTLSAGRSRPAEPAQALQRLLDPPPDLVLLFMGPEEDPAALDAATIVATLEAQVAALGGSPPLYVAGPRWRQDVALQQLVSGRSSLRSRWVGVAADPNPELVQLAELQQRFRAAYPEQPVAGAPPLGALAGVYDSLYLLAYGLFAAPGTRGALSAADVLAGFRRVTAGSAAEPLQIGPGEERIGLGLQILGSGASLQLGGVSGPLGFRPEDRTRTGQPGVHVITADGQLVNVDIASAFDTAATLPE